MHRCDPRLVMESWLDYAVLLSPFHFISSVLSASWFLRAYRPSSMPLTRPYVTTMEGA
jgi:hypothetical protein